MDRRIESRFQVYSSAKLTLLDDPEREELDCRLVDISGSGMKLVSDVELAEGQMISLETAQHVVLAEVRRCSVRGSKFEIGGERVHVVPAAALEKHTNKTDRIKALVESYHLRILQGLDSPLLGPGLIAGEATPAPKQPPVVPGGTPVVPGIVTEGAAEHAGAQPCSADEASHPAQVEGDADPLGTHRTSLRAPELAAARHDRAQRRLTPWVVGAALSTALAVLLIATTMTASFSLASWRTAVKKTIETVWSKKPPARTSQTGGTALMPEAAKAPELAQVHLPAPGESAPPGLDQRPPAVRASAGAPVIRHASFKITGTSWVSACADGQKLFEKLLSPGEVRQIEFPDKAVVRVGNAGQVEIAVDGKPVGPLGRTGQLRLLELSAQGMRVLPMGDPADDCAIHRTD